MSVARRGSTAFRPVPHVPTKADYDEMLSLLADPQWKRTTWRMCRDEGKDGYSFCATGWIMHQKYGVTPQDLLATTAVSDLIGEYNIEAASARLQAIYMPFVEITNAFDGVREADDDERDDVRSSEHGYLSRTIDKIRVLQLIAPDYPNA